MRYTWKRTVILLFSVFLLTLCACQKTPEKKAVVNKNGGIAKENIIDRINDNEVKEMNIPSHWKETMESNDGRVSVAADLDIEKPSVRNTPVWEMSSKQLTQKKLEELVKYFVENKKLYAQPRLTKMELQEEIDRMDKQEGIYSEWSLNDDEKRARAIELQKKAPSVPEEKKYIKPQFTNPVKSERDEILGAEYDDIVTTENNTFSALVDDDGNKSARIEATQYNKIAGTTSCFSYQKVDKVMSELWIEQGAELQAYYDVQTSESSAEERERRKKENELHQSVLARESAMSPEEAIKLAEIVISDLKIEGMVLLRTEKVVIIDGHTLPTTISDEDWNAGKTGYTFVYSTGVEGLPVNEYISEGVIGGMPEEDYQPPFQPERIEITVGDEEIVSFSWSNMSEKEGVIAENTKLLPFEQIKEKLMDHVYYSSTSPDPKQNSDKSIMTSASVVKNVTFQYVYCSAYEEPSRAWLVPAWIFKTEDSYMLYGKKVPTGTKRVAINAIDGSFVKRGEIGE